MVELQATAELDMFVCGHCQRFLCFQRSYHIEPDKRPVHELLWLVI